MNTIEVVPGITQIIDKRANMFLLADEKLTLIDAGFASSAPIIIDAIHRTGRTPAELELVILTHNHYDHTGAVKELRKHATFKIAAYPADFALLNSFMPYPMGKSLWKLLKTPGFSWLKRRMLPDIGQIDIELEDRQVLPVNGGLQVIYTPGHTAGSISLYNMTHKILFVSDALNKRNGMPLRTVSTDYRKAAKSVYRMAELDVSVLCFGHGKPIKVGGNIYLRNLAGKLKKKQH